MHDDKELNALENEELHKSEFNLMKDLKRKVLNSKKIPMFIKNSIVEVYDIKRLANNSKMCMEILPGNSFMEFDFNNATRQQKLEIYFQLSLIMESFHKLGIIHKDIKLDNIFIETTAFGQIIVKIGDFGTSF